MPDAGTGSEEENKARRRGVMDFCVLSTMALSSFASGALTCRSERLP